VTAAWHSPVERCREGSRTMPVSNRQTGDKEKTTLLRNSGNNVEGT
jgi:hypothetical protein